MPDNNTSLREIPKHDVQVNASVEDRSILKDLCESAMKEYIIPRSTELLWNMAGGMINMFADALKSSVGKILYKDSTPPTMKTNQNSGYYTGSTNYTSFSTPIKTYQQSSQKPRDTIGQRPGNMVKYIWVESEEKAKLVINTLRDDITRYKRAKVASLYEMVGVRTTIADFNYGWTDPNDLRYYEDTSRAPGENRWFLDLSRPVDITMI